MTPQQVYALKWQSRIVPFDGSCDMDFGIFGRASYYNHMPELSADMMYQGQFQSCERVMVAVHGEYWLDTRRFWRLSSAWFDHQPFMIMQNAGREGDDHVQRWITDRAVYGAAVTHIYSIYCSDNDHMVHPHTELGDLTEFYGEKLEVQPNDQC